MGSRVAHFHERLVAVWGDRVGHLEHLEEGLAFRLLPGGRDHGVALPPERRGVNPVGLGQPRVHQEVWGGHGLSCLHDFRARVLGVVGAELHGVGVVSVGCHDSRDSGDVDLVVQQVEVPPPAISVTWPWLPINFPSRANNRPARSGLLAVRPSLQPRHNCRGVRIGQRGRLR